MVCKKRVCGIPESCWTRSCSKVNSCRVGCDKEVPLTRFLLSLFNVFCASSKPLTAAKKIICISSLCSSLGKPRRFSEHFLKEEKYKLNQYRESVRRHYSELRAGTREGLPTDLARPLSVGQRVIAIHPRTRNIQDGSILTVDHSRCYVQFDRPELGVEYVMVILLMITSIFDMITC